MYIIYILNKLHNAQVKGYLLGIQYIILQRSVTVWLCKYTLQYCHQKKQVKSVRTAFQHLTHLFSWSVM